MLLSSHGSCSTTPSAAVLRPLELGDPRCDRSEGAAIGVDPMPVIQRHNGLGF